MPDTRITTTRKAVPDTAVAEEKKAIPAAASAEDAGPGSALTATAQILHTLYIEETGKSMGELRMQKLLYFAQKAALRDLKKPLFPECFQGWRFGPVLPCLHEAYRKGNPFAENLGKEGDSEKEAVYKDTQDSEKTTNPEKTQNAESTRISKKTQDIENPLTTEEISILTQVYHQYRQASDWTMNALTQEEFSWLYARDGLDPEENGNVEISLASIEIDIFKDAINRKFEDFAL